MQNMTSTGPRFERIATGEQPVQNASAKPMTAPIFESREISVSYGDKLAVRNVGP